jgi:hypothetical protein
LRRAWGEHKTHQSIDKSVAMVLRLLKREQPSSPSVTGILSSQEFAALEHLASYAAACRRRAPTPARSRSRKQLEIWPSGLITGRRELLGDWSPASKRRSRA